MRPLSSIFIALLLMGFSAVAVAKPADKLVRHVPKSSQMVIGLELSKVKSSFLYQEAMALFKAQASPKSLLGFVLSKKAFDVEKDVNAGLVAFETAPTNPQAPPPPAMAVVDGTFDAARVKAAIEAEYGKVSTRKQGAIEVHSTKGVEFAFLDANTLVIAEASYAAATWKAVASESEAVGANPMMKSMIDLTDTTRGLWLAMDTSKIPTQPGAAPMDGAGLALDVRSGLALDFRSQFAKEEDAKKAMAQVEDMKKQSGNDPLIGMLGAKPLVDNLKASIEKGRVLAMMTTMKDSEVKTMLGRLQSMAQAPPPIAPPTGAAPGTTTPVPNQTPQPPPPVTGKGSAADFN